MPDNDFYRIKGLAPGFDGLVAEVEWYREFAGDRFAVVKRLFNTNQIIGDRTYSVAMAPKALMISTGYLQRTDDPTKREFDSRNPFGRLLSQTDFNRDGIHAASAVFENAMSVSVLDTRAHKTLFSHYFKTGKPKQVLAEAFSREGNVDDLVFKLQQIVEEELNDGKEG